MLVLSRKLGESFFVGDNVEITISEIGNDKVKIRIDAPKEIVILRRELKELKAANAEAAVSIDADANFIKNIFKK